ncbi:NAD(P)/FAD-dependent oxidoreductase [Antarcticirhabdus aurantiaca]|uniref:FAD-binding oxidoreductase n=1 Tax=Antarcticirhabdus aurantiaca TaxID=2606717 RepID=A0ACD4NHU6_9HYPH|nr:FAD-binding oxidoreductase [Antarcticirhabdus aurantiaca]WAJ26351.1 FAD-binding oxidoreductase [Jeongeuplla avenae]
MTDDPRSHGLWAKTAPPAPDTPPLSGERRVDVAVVGAGYTGLSAALHLAEAGARVAVLEAAEIGHGGSGRNVGLVNAGLWVMPDALPEILGPVHGERILSLLGAAPALVFELVERHAIACEAVRAGTLHCGVGHKGAAELAERARQWQARGADVALLGGAEAERLIGSPCYRAALLDRRAGTIQPLAYARGLARAAIAAGAAVHARSPVLRHGREGPHLRLETPAGALVADWVVVATNAYTETPWPEIREEIVRLPYFNIATAPLSDNLAASILPERQGAWDTKSVLSSFRMDGQGRLILGSVGRLDRGAAPLHRRWARETLARLFPQLGPVAFEAEWFGAIGMTADAAPRLHRLGERVLSFSGYNGRGIAPGTTFGRVLAEHILDRMPEDELPLPTSEPRPRPFRALRELGIDLGSRVAHLTARG